MPDPLVDWTRIAGIYAQCVRCLASSDRYLPPSLPAFLGELLGRASASYQGQEARFIDDATAALTAVDPDRYSKQDLVADRRFVAHSAYVWREDAPRRRPTPFESLIETARRLRDFTEIEQRLRPVSDAAIVGGSMSYGRFYNVKGNLTDGERVDEGSDLDLLVVTEDPVRLLRALEGLPGVEVGSIASGIERAEAFVAHRQAGEVPAPVVFSHKVHLWENEDPVLADLGVDGRYHLSLHIFDEASFGALMLKDVRSVDQEGLGDAALISDFRETAPNRADQQRSFAGIELMLELESKAVGASILRETNLYRFADGRFFPGMFQNLVLPAFYVQWSSRDILRLVESFRWKMVDRLRVEQVAFPDELLRLSFSHTRSEVFSPHIVRSVDSSTYLS